MIRPAAFCLAMGCAALAALTACATQDDAVQRNRVPGNDLGALRLADVPEDERIELARKGQLQTPLRLSPEATGAPPPVDRSPNGPMLDAGTLVRAGVDIRPDVRVWVEQGGLARLNYGPRPRSETDLSFRPGVAVTPF